LFPLIPQTREFDDKEVEMRERKRERKRKRKRMRGVTEYVEKRDRIRKAYFSPSFEFFFD